MEAGSMQKMSNREMKKTVKTEKQFKGNNKQKNHKQFRANQGFKDKAASIFKENLFRSVFHKLALG